MTRNRWFWALIGLSLLALGCGRGPTTPDTAGEFGPTSSAAIPDYRGAVPAAPIVPDDPYFRMMTAEDRDSHRVVRWEGGLMRHCFIDPFPEAEMERLATEITQLTGIGRKWGGDCNVTWMVDETLGPKVAASTGFDARGGSYDRVWVRVNGLGNLVNAHHEAGHVMGLLHSDRKEDLMWPWWDRRNQDEFSPAEVRVIRWLYGR